MASLSPTPDRKSDFRLGKANSEPAWKQAGSFYIGRKRYWQKKILAEKDIGRKRYWPKKILA
jgi:hypothetical protein